MVKIVQRRYYKSVVYLKEVNGEQKEFKEIFFDDKYAFIRANEIEKGMYDVEYNIVPTMMVLDYLDIYMKSVFFKSYSLTTYETYVSIIKNYLVYYFKNKTLKEIDKVFVKKLNDKIENQVMVGINHINIENKIIGYELKGDIKSFLNKAFEYATEKGIYSINPMQHLKGNYKTCRFSTEWDLETLRVLIEKSGGQRINVLFHCLFGTELLIKEALAMTWSQVHIDDNNLAKDTCYIEIDRYLGRKRLSDIKEMGSKVIKVFPTVLYKSGRTRLIIYKSNQSRKVYIPVIIAKLLKEWRLYQKKQIERMSDGYEDNDLVIALSNGRACEDRIINKEFDAIKELYHLPDVKLAKLKSFSRKWMFDGEKSLTMREYFYLSCYDDECSVFNIGNLRKKIVQTKRLTNKNDYQFVDLKNIEIPAKKNIDILKAVTLIKNDPCYANELASILKK